MGQVLTLDIPNEVYEPLLKKAKQAGCTPEDIVLEWLIRSMQNLTDDPLLQLAGTFESPLIDVSGKHDDYIGKALQEELSRSHYG
ncbi:hypothetical protein [Candidatus Entotheonella palauensis]|uniref:CopG family transcriptional regulator n=1 Tax=Candidatus Entotheonella gemina TaxID=1429439 RepID=W4M0S0_9BACT|nr:hypothetical protein [Candidatus Entotheonella palauensis]ETX03924.1 MAG: hypothetical protein ETSY2_31755 [Candidatus Entotheonella gemina]